MKKVSTKFLLFAPIAMLVATGFWAEVEYWLQAIGGHIYG